MLDVIAQEVSGGGGNVVPLLVALGAALGALGGIYTALNKRKTDYVANSLTTLQAALKRSDEENGRLRHRIEELEDEVERLRDVADRRRIDVGPPDGTERRA